MARQYALIFYYLQAFVVIQPVIYSHFFGSSCKTGSLLSTTDFRYVSRYYGPGPYLAWLLNITYVLARHEWRVIALALRNLASNGLQPYPDSSATPDDASWRSFAPEIAPLRLDANTLVAILYPVLSHVYGFFCLLRASNYPDDDATSNARSVAEVKTEAVMIVLQMSMFLVLPSLIWRQIERVASWEARSGTRRSSPERLRLWRALWIAGALMLAVLLTMQVIVLQKVQFSKAAFLGLVPTLAVATYIVENMTPRQSDFFMWMSSLTLPMTGALVGNAIGTTSAGEVFECASGRNKKTIFAFPRSGSKFKDPSQFLALGSGIAAVLYSIYSERDLAADWAVVRRWVERPRDYVLNLTRDTF